MSFFLYYEITWTRQILTKSFWISRPEVKENKEGADTEKAAEEEKESDKELVKEKVNCMQIIKKDLKFSFFFFGVFEMIRDF